MSVQALHTRNARPRIREVPHLDASICSTGDHDSLAKAFNEDHAANVTFVLFEDSSFALFGPSVSTVAINLPRQDLSVAEAGKQQPPLPDGVLMDPTGNEGMSPNLVVSISVAAFLQPWTLNTKKLVSIFFCIPSTLTPKP